MASPRKRRLRKLIRAGRDPRKVEVPEAATPVAAPVGVAPIIAEPVTKKAARKPKNKVKAKE